MSLRIKIIPGTKYSALTVLSEAKVNRLPSGQINRFIKCQCECGLIKDIRLLHLVRGRISSCGCKRNTLKGESQTYLCKVWKGMIRRCNEDYSEKHLYFDKGIKVCNEWVNDYFVFKKWALENGYKKGLQIDRQDNSKGYEPNNCRWVTCKTNNNNRDNTLMVTYNGEKYAFMLLVEKLNRTADYKSIRARIVRGWDAQKAFDTQIRIGNYYRRITIN